MTWLLTAWAFLVGASLVPGVLWLVWVGEYSSPAATGTENVLWGLVAGVVFGAAAVAALLWAAYRTWG